jgi:hypothetical protein
VSLAPGSSAACPTEYSASVDGVPLGLPGGCCDEATGDCAILFEIDCAVTFLGTGSDCAGCAPTTSLFRADSADRSVDGLFVVPRRADGIAFASPFDLPRVCPVSSGDLDPEPVLEEGSPTLQFYQINDPLLESLRVEKDEAAASVRVLW